MENNLQQPESPLPKEIPPTLAQAVQPQVSAATQAAQTPSAGIPRTPDNLIPRSRTIEKVKTGPVDETGVSPLRTYQSDVEVYMKSQNGSLTKIAVAEQNKKTEAPATEVPHRSFPKKAMIVISLILVLGGAGTVAGLFIMRKPEPVVQTKFVFTPTITTDLQKEFNISGQSRENIFGALVKERDSAEIALGSVLSVYFTKGQGEGKLLVSPQELLQVWNARPPGELTRSLTGNPTFGFHSSNGNQPFLILKITDYQNGFAGMLAWERTMEDGIGSLFIREAKDKVTESATSSDELLVVEKQFKDLIIRNRDVRALVGRSGAVEILYVFPDPTTIIITTNERTVEEVVRRLIQSKIIR